MLFQLGYMSVAAQPQTTVAINKIVSEARPLNLSAGITGKLVCSSNRFFQVLEGPRFEVEATMDRIERDLRHHSVVRLYGCHLPYRDFEQWTMAVKIVPSQETQILGRRFLELVGNHCANETQARFQLQKLLTEGFQLHA